MINWLVSLFKRRLVLVIDAPVPTIGPEDNESIKTLAHHPGYEALLAKLKIQRAVLKTRLCNDVLTEREVISLQSGIYWSRFFEREVQKLVSRRAVPKAVVASADIMDEFKRITGTYERIGSTEGV